MRRSVMALPFAVLGMAVAVGFRAQETRRVVFAVRAGETIEIDPLVVIRDGEWLDPMGRGGEDEPARWREYYATHPELRLLAHNEVIAAGHAGPTPPPPCFDLLGSLASDGPAPVAPDWIGLASTDTAFGGPPLGRPPLPAERATLLAAARDVARRGGIEDSLVARLEPNGALLTVTAETGAPIAMAGGFSVSSWRIEAGWEVDRLIAAFVILRADGRIWLQWLNDATGDAVSSRSLIDVIDLTLDGTPELIVRSMGYEGWGYDVWDVIDGDWSRIFTGGGGGC